MKNKKKISYILLISFFFNMIMPNITFANDSWYRFKGNDKNTGRSTAIGPNEPVQIWKYITGDNQIATNPVIDMDGTIYFGTQKGNFYAINKDGSLKWRYIGNEAIVSTPVVSSLGIYFTTKKKIIGLSKTNGYAIFISNSDFNFNKYSNILISNDEKLLYVNESYNKFHIFDIYDFKHIKEIKTEGVTSSATKDDSGNIYFTDKKYLYCISPTLNIKKLSLPTNIGNSSPVIGDNGIVYVSGSISGSTGYGKIYAIKNYENLTKIWTHTFGIGEWPLGDIISLSKNSTILFLLQEHLQNVLNLYALNPDGTIKFKKATSYNMSMEYQSIIVDKNENIYFLTNDNKLVSFDLDGNIRWEFAIDEETDFTFIPAMGSDGTIYVTTKQGNLYAITDKSNLNKNPIFISQPIFDKDWVGNQDKINITGIIKDENVGDKITIKYSIKNTPITNQVINLVQPSSIISNGQNQAFQGNIILNELLSGDFIIQLWAEDNKGGKSEVIEVPITVFNTLENILESLRNYVHQSEETQFLIINSNTTITQTLENDRLIEEIRQELERKNVKLFFIGLDGETENYIRAKLLY